jgi:hypothetical protein
VLRCFEELVSKDEPGVSPGVGGEVGELGGDYLGGLGDSGVRVHGVGVPVVVGEDSGGPSLGGVVLELGYLNLYKDGMS